MATIPNWGAAASTLDGTEQLPLWQGGAGAHGTVAYLKTFIAPLTTLGDLLYGGASGASTRLAGNTTTTKKFLTQTGDGAASAAPAWFDLFGTANTWTAASFAISSGVTTGTTTSAGLSVSANSLTSGTGMYVGSSSITTGKLVNLASTSTAAQGATGLNIDLSGTLTNNGQTTYGGQISVTTANATSGTNVGLKITATGATTANYALVVPANSGYVGFGTITPATQVELSKDDATTNPSISNISSLTLANPNGSAGSGSQLLFKSYTGTNNVAAGISFYTGASSGTGTTGNLLFSLQGAAGDGSLTEVLRLTGTTGTALFQPRVTTGTTASAGLSVLANSLTSGTGFYVGSSSITTGKLLNLASTSTDAQGMTGLNIAISGTLTNAAQTTYGEQISVTTTNGTSGTNVALKITASGALTANYALQVAAGDLDLSGNSNLVFGTSTGTKIGTANTQKIGFWNATPVVQQVLATGAGATVDNVITMLQTIGLCKQS